MDAASSTLDALSSLAFETPEENLDLEIS